MSIANKDYINVLNYNENVVIIQTRDNEHKLNPMSDEKPSTVPLTMSEIEFIHSNTPTFSSGLLRFPEDVEKDVYEKLRIQNYDQILKNSDIEDTILNPTMEKLQRFVNISSSSTFERVRGIFTKLKNSGHDVSVRVERIINERYRELINRQTKSNIILTPKDTAIKNGEVENLKAQITQMQEMMETLIKNQTINTTSPPNEPIASESVSELEQFIENDDEADTFKRKAGRPHKGSK